VVHIKGDKMKRVLALGSALVVFGLTGTVGAAASPPSPAPCTLGALNMLHDATMATIPMTHDAAQGNAGMSTAVAVSGCKWRHADVRARPSVPAFRSASLVRPARAV